MSTWPTTKLDDLCRKITVGHVGKMSDQYVERGVPFLRSQDIKPGFIEQGNVKYISQAFHERIIKSSLSPGDVVMVRTGYPGTAAVVPNTLPVANCADLVIAKPGPRLEPRYLAYLMNSPWGKGMVGGRLVGAAQQHFNVRVAQALEIPTPPLAIQKRIAAILGAYDDLIEVNQRRVAVLEEMAQGLFEEWFVRFRFPGHEDVPIIDTSEGPLPEGWEFAPFTDVADVLSGGTPKKSRPEYWGGDVPFFTPKDAPKTAWVFDTISNVTNEGVQNCNSKLYPVGTVFITARGTVGKIAFAARPMAMNQSCYALVGKDYPQSFVFGLTQEARNRLQRMSGGAVFDTIIVDTFRKLRLPKPPRELARAYDEQALPLLEMSKVLTESNNHLATSRDLLLPRLISGQLSVEAAERDLEDVA